VRHHEHPVVAQKLLEHHDLADALEAAGRHDVEGLVEHHLAPADSSPGSTDGETATRIFAPAREDVDGGIVVGLDDQAVGRRRLGQPVNLALSVMICSRASFRVRTRRSFCEGQGRQRGLQLQYTVLEVTPAVGESARWRRRAATSSARRAR
jgi:hypothetical protein